MTIAAIYLWPVKRGDPVPVSEALARLGGLEGDRQRGARRQVTFVSEDDWADAAREVSATADVRWRRANVVVRGGRIGDALGRKLEIGAARFEILGETEPCHRMDEVHPGLKEALVPARRGGVFGAVLEDGLIRVGDTIVVV
jgi:MOSC domain-containing protein YiiM